MRYGHLWYRMTCHPGDLNPAFATKVDEMEILRHAEVRQVTKEVGVGGTNLEDGVSPFVP